MSLSAELRRLRDLDWRELNLREAGGWPVSLQVISCLLVLAAVFWLVQWFVVAPQADSLERAQAQESELLDQYEAKAYQAANLPTMREQMGELEARMAELLQMLPTGAEVPTLIDNISDTALENQLIIDFIRLRTPVPQAFYTEQPFDIQVRGDYHRIAAFLSGVAGLPRIVTLHDFTLTPLDEAGTLQLSMLARTYSHREEAAP
ncbi:type 4a pilus biogenesis protein PilO [Halomonas sp. McH1-25]|uniref:type 4a pilus biogenesis protein PilO n=1 Tax=unclassified Halomonas TaxID=2609666 RepID=UPI001EF5F786|nr:MULTISPECIES: type 4a pilus biogenesis protein PilO [unclassified Halomonas]MCG7601428.1 type 4a pilus biogenesis protein PilO [Halomonas sp. McH1-25]MCP1341969.1 type 4a pilus biogenesis protein PilO [Halomonas sp. FL8]MCP1362896.1 type 4a pilus biogenesis protein PilO [Halomonas sp. BBD45]MCP1363891.1 type 4a pilus biogenesis protein PilO [Halomonas sp. BBD48]